MRRRNTSPQGDEQPEQDTPPTEAVTPERPAQGHWSEWGEHEEQRVASWLRSRRRPAEEEVAASAPEVEEPAEPPFDPWALPEMADADEAAPAAEHPSRSLIAEVEAELVEVERQEQQWARERLAGEVAELQERRDVLAARLAEEEAQAEQERAQRGEDLARREAEVDVLVARREQLALSAEAALAAVELARQDELETRARVAELEAAAAVHHGPTPEPAFDVAGDVGRVVAELRAERAVLAVARDADYVEADQVRRELIAVKARLQVERDEVADLEAQRRELAVALVAERCDGERVRVELEEAVVALDEQRRLAGADLAEARRLVDERLEEGARLEAQLAELVERRRRLVQEAEAATAVAAAAAVKAADAEREALDARAALEEELAGLEIELGDLELRRAHLSVVVAAAHTEAEQAAGRTGDLKGQVDLLGAERERLVLAVEVGRLKAEHLAREAAGTARSVGKLREEEREARTALAALEQQLASVESSHFQTWVELDREINELEERRRQFGDGLTVQD